MKNVYNYTFFQIHQSLVKTKDLTPVGTSIIVFSFNQFVNVLTILLLFKVKIDYLLSKSLYIGICFVLLCFINALYLLIKKKYKIIIEEYLVESEQQIKKGWTYVRLYMILSVIILFAVIIFK
jgi:hypothetical protein